MSFGLIMRTRSVTTAPMSNENEIDNDGADDLWIENDSADDLGGTILAARTRRHDLVGASGVRRDWALGSSVKSKATL